jgi:Glycosyltransferase family 87
MSTAATIADPTLKPTPLRALFDISVMAICGAGFAAMLLGFTLLLLTNNHPGGRDFVSYWTAGHQLLHHANPYDATAILRAERAVGFPADGQSLIMRNAPWALPLVLPLGALSLNAGALAWSALLVLCLTLSGYLLFHAFNPPQNCHPERSGAAAQSKDLRLVRSDTNSSKLHLLAFTFAPALICILCGQTAVISLLGLALFLRYHSTHPIRAGAALWLCALKPHLFLPFAVALLLWIITTRAWRLLAGFTTIMLASSLLATALTPAIWADYAHMMHSANIDREFIPCLAVALRFAILPAAMWLQYLPAVLACIWAIPYFFRNRRHWDWLSHGAVLMLVSITFAPYAWIMDQSLLIPAVLFALYRASSITQIEIFALISAVMEFAMSFSIGAHSLFYLWTAPFWLLWFLHVTHRFNSPVRPALKGRDFSPAAGR